MWKPRVLRPRPRLRLGEGAARFASEILARHGPSPDSQRYPEAWLVLREEEEREAVQAAGDLRLTQLTLRLALQLNEYFTSQHREERTVMEVTSLRETLRTCLTALESRDRETCREVRLLTASLPPAQPQSHVSSEKVREVRLLRERLERRLEHLERLERTQHRQAASGSVRASLSSARSAPEPWRGPKAEQSRIPHSPDPSAPARRGPSEPSLLSPALRPRQGIPFSAAMATALGQQSSPARRAEAALTGHKERLLQLLSRTDTAQREEIWHLVEEQTYLTAHRQQWTREEYHLSAEEKLERLVRESSHREYVTLLQTLQRQLRLGAPPREEPSSEQRPFPAAQAAQASPAARPEPLRSAPLGETAADPGSAAAQARQAAPLLSWLDQALQQGRVRRTAFQQQLQSASPAAQSAFLALAHKSGAFHKGKRKHSKAGGEPLTREEQLTLLSRESGRQELQALIRWTRSREERTAIAQEAAPPASSPPVKARPLLYLPETAAARELKRFLLQGTGEYRRELIRILTAARPGERESLAAGLLEAAGTGALPPESSEAEASGSGAILRLLERSADPVSLLEQVKTTRAIRSQELMRTRERTVLERLSTFTQSRGNSREAESAQLTQGLDREEKRILLKHLQAVRPLPQPAGSESAPSAARPEQQLLQLLSFQTQKEYKSFRYHLNQYLMGQPPPPQPLLAEVTRWAEDRRRWETLELARPSSAVPERQKPEKPQDPVPPQAAPQVWSQGAVPPVFFLQARRTKEAPSPSLLSPVQPLRGLRQTTEQIRLSPLPAAAVRPSRRQPGRQTGRRPGPYESPVLPLLLSSEMVPLLQHQPEGQAVRSGPAAPPPALREPTSLLLSLHKPGRQKETGGTEAPSFPIPAGILSRLPRRQSPEQQMTRHGAEPPALSPLTRAALPPRVLTPARTEDAPPGSLPSDLRAGVLPPVLRSPQRRPGPTEVRAETRPSQGTGDRTPSPPPRLAALFRAEAAERSAPAAGPYRMQGTIHRVLSPAPFVGGPSPDIALLHPRAQGAPPPPGGRRNGPREIPLPAEEAPELELRRDHAPQAVRETARQAAQERVELAVQRQAPELHLLRRQTQEQERALEQQKHDLSGLEQRLERQEAMVRKAVEQVRVPGAEEPAQVRRLAKAVMKELEGQLRLERQRRGLR